MLTGLVGDGAGAFMVFLAWMFMRHIQYFGKFGPWVLRLAVIGAFIGGSLMVGTTAGTWGAGLIDWMVNLGGGVGWLIAAAIAVVLIFLVVIGLWRAHSHKAVMAAALLPLMFTVFGGGVLHQLGQSTVAPAQQQGTQIVHSLTGRGPGHSAAPRRAVHHHRASLSH